jgi:hypothetical protein
MKIHRYPVQLRGPSRASSVARSRLGIDWLNRIVAALSASQQQPDDSDRDLLTRARRHQQSRRAARNPTTHLHGN